MRGEVNRNKLQSRNREREQTTAIKYLKIKNNFKHKK